jgi:hypothetical protein
MGLSRHFKLAKKALWLKIVGASTVTFLLGLLAGWLVFGSNHTLQVTPVYPFTTDTSYSLINPVLYIEIPESLSYPEYTPLKNVLTSYVTAKKESGQVSDISIYYRDLNTKDWVGINPTENFNAASMMKVATLIALLQSSETEPQVLSANLSVPSSYVIPGTGNQYYLPPSNPVRSGNTYSVQYLMQRMITQSDNGADSLLVTYLGNQKMANVFNDLRIPQPGTSSGISVQNYSHLFRALYNGNYLSHADSQRALQLLTQTNFTAGLVAGVPTNTIVAHKFGESVYAYKPDSTSIPTVVGLNDCGIVYRSKDPYFLCVMTKGADFNTLAGVIKDVSQITWNQMSALYPS